MQEVTPLIEQGLTTADRGHEACRDGPEACRESPDYQDRNCGTECQFVGKNKKPLQQCVGCGLVLLTMLVLRSGAISSKKPLPVRINGTVGLVAKRETFRKDDMIQANCDLKGGDLLDKDAETSSLCQDLCWNTSACFHWTHRNHTCYLKSGSSNPSIDKTSTSGWKAMPRYPEKAFCYPDDAATKMDQILKKLKDVEQDLKDLGPQNHTSNTYKHAKVVEENAGEKISKDNLNKTIKLQRNAEAVKYGKGDSAVTETFDKERKWKDLVDHYNQGAKERLRKADAMIRDRNEDSLEDLKEKIDMLVKDRATSNYHTALEMYKECPRGPDVNKRDLRKCLHSVLQKDKHIGRAWARYGLLHGWPVNGHVVNKSWCFQQSLRYNLDITSLTFNECPEEPRMGQDDCGAYDLCELGKALARDGGEVLADSIAKALSENVPLKALDLRGTRLNEEGLCGIVEALINNTVLRSLNLRGQLISHKLRLAMAKGGLELQDRLVLDSDAKRLLDMAYSKPLFKVDSAHQGIYCGPGVGGKPDTTEVRGGSGDCSLYAKGNLHIGSFSKTTSTLAAFVLASGELYVGGFDDHPRKGEGIMVWHNGDRYQGEWKQGKMDGVGTYIWAVGNTYLGEYKEGMADGTGTMSFPSGARYTGSWKRDKKHGFGVYTWADGGEYTGDWKEGLRDGQGNKIWPDGAHYEGSWKNDMMNGNGTYTWASGKHYTGHWKDDWRNGWGLMFWRNGDRYAGLWKHARRVGNGTYTWADGKKYTGDHKDGMQNGMGMMVWPDGHYYYGAWRNGHEVNGYYADTHNKTLFCYSQTDCERQGVGVRAAAPTGRGIAFKLRQRAS